MYQLKAKEPVKKGPKSMLIQKDKLLEKHQHVWALYKLNEQTITSTQKEICRTRTAKQAWSVEVVNTWPFLKATNGGLK